MAETFTCPRCDEGVPEPPGSAGQVTMGTLGEGNIKYAQCPRCQAWLERVPTASNPSWQLQRGVEQPSRQDR